MEHALFKGLEPTQLAMGLISSADGSLRELESKKFTSDSNFLFSSPTCWAQR